MRMGVSLDARKHPVLTTLRDTKAQVTPVGERGRDHIINVRTAPRGVDPASNQVFDQGTGEFPLPLAGQPGRERGGNGLPKKPARAGPTSWVAGGEEQTWGLGSGRSVTKRAIPFRARQNGRARAVWCPSRLVRRRLPTHIERTRSASAIGSVFLGGIRWLLHKLIPAPTGSCEVSPSLLNFPRKKILSRNDEHD
uniref:Uncharacterized protein n=1 Tax=Vitis vinifera TaxID=29760 RepID=A5BTL1_VITVI|nr:hypothetical protein VITISV_021757 [Vitis vinifera]